MAWEALPAQPKEMACCGSGKLTVVNGLLGRLDVLRDRCGFPLAILSALCSPCHNFFMVGEVFEDIPCCGFSGIDPFHFERG